MLSLTRPLLTLSDCRFRLGRAIPDRGSEDCRHVDHGQIVTGIQDANMKGSSQEVNKMVANLTASLLGWKTASSLTALITWVNGKT